MTQYKSEVEQQAILLELEAWAKDFSAQIKKMVKKNYTTFIILI